MGEKGEVDTIVDVVDASLNSVQEERTIDPVAISLVPSGLRNVSPTSFKPRMVSIGPIHNKDENLQAFGEQKLRYMGLLLKSVGSPRMETLKECVQKVVDSAGKIRAAYATINTEKYSNQDLSVMMVVDACFILQYVSEICGSNGEPERHLANVANKIWPFPKKESQRHVLPIIYDLVLVENQIPYFILQDIFKCTILKAKRESAPRSLDDLILSLARILNVFESKFLDINETENNPITHDHILGFLHRCYWSPNKYCLPGLPSTAIHSTEELMRAGVSVMPNPDDQAWKLAIEFQPSFFTWCSRSLGKPTLRMPVLRIDNYTELVLRNLIAYEQSMRSRTYVTSYAMAMDMLVDNENDIAKLIKSKVVVNHLGSNQKAAIMMNNLCKGLPLLTFYYVEQWKNLEEHHNRYWPKNIAALKRTYFNSPWSIIALVAGIALFALTVVQTIYTVNGL